MPTFESANFKVDTEAGTVEGPRLYLNERGERLIASAQEGKSLVFNLACLEGSPVEVALGVALQTDYAAWLGQKQLERALTKEAR